MTAHLLRARVWTDGDVSHRADIAARALTASGPEESPQLRVFGLPGIAPTLAYACVERAGQHWAEDHFLVEIVGAPSDQTCTDGETGDVVLTDLTREGSPLLRFSTGFTAALDGLRVRAGGLRPDRRRSSRVNHARRVNGPTHPPKESTGLPTSSPWGPSTPTGPPAPLPW